MLYICVYTRVYTTVYADVSGFTVLPPPVSVGNCGGFGSNPSGVLVAYTLRDSWAFSPSARVLLRCYTKSLLLLFIVHTPYINHAMHTYCMLCVHIVSIVYMLYKPLTSIIRLEASICSQP